MERAVLPTLALLVSCLSPCLAQISQNVVVFEVTEPGFLWDGHSIFDVTFTSSKGANLVVEPISVPGSAGPLSHYIVHGLSGEPVTLSSPGHETKVVNTAGQTFIDVWLAVQGDTQHPVSSRYWYGPATSGTPATAATLGGDPSNLYFASTNNFGQIAIGRMDRPVLITGETSPTGAAIASNKNNLLYLAWAGSGSHPYLNVMSSPNGSTWTNKHTLTDQFSNNRPALSAYGDTGLAMAWTGTDHRLNVAFSNDGGSSWSGQQTLPYYTNLSPALLTVQNTLFLSWIDQRTNAIVVAAWNGVSWTQLKSTETSNTAPSLSVVDDELLVCWAGTNNHLINTMAINTITLNQFALKKTYNLKSDNTPLVIPYRWPNAIGSQRALPLFVLEQGQTNVAQRFWSDLEPPPFIESTGSLFPRYMVVSIVYAPPSNAGPNKSSIKYGSKSELGTSVSIEESFKSGNNLSISAGVHVGVFSADAGGSFGVSSSSSDSQTDEVKLTTNIERQFFAYGSTDGVTNAHDLDQIVIWLNPSVNIGATATGIQWSLGAKDTNTAYLVYPYVKWLKSPSLMMKESPDTYRALLNHGLTPATDFPKLLALDPFAFNPAPVLDPSRFVNTRYSVRYQPGPNPQSNPSHDTFTSEQFNSTAINNTKEDGYSVGLTADAGFDIGIVKASLKDEQTWTWNHKATRANSASTTLETTVDVWGPTYGYVGPEQIELYWDSRFGSILFVPETDPGTPADPAVPTTTVSGVLLGVAADSASRQVVLVDTNGTEYKTLADLSGNFHFSRVPLGPAQISSRSSKLPVNVQPLLKSLTLAR